MKSAILLELASRWERDAIKPDVISSTDASPEGQRWEANQETRRETKRECADALRSLVDLLG